jgi:hypothetical protein
MRQLASSFRGPIVAIEPPRPQAVPGAVWQAGLTPKSDQLKVLLDGCPVLLAFAASDVAGWVLCHPEPTLTRTRPTSRAPLGFAFLIDPFADKVRLTGVVQIVPCRGF